MRIAGCIRFLVLRLFTLLEHAQAILRLKFLCHRNAKTLIEIALFQKVARKHSGWCFAPRINHYKKKKNKKLKNDRKFEANKKKIIRKMLSSNKRFQRILLLFTTIQIRMRVTSRTLLSTALEMRHTRAHRMFERSTQDATNEPYDENVLVRKMAAQKRCCMCIVFQ